MFVTALIVLPTVGLVAWAWLAMAHVDEKLRELQGFEGLHFGIGPQDAELSEASLESYPAPAPRARRGRHR